MATAHSGHKRGLGAPLVVVVLLLAGLGAAAHLLTPARGVYRDTTAAAVGAELHRASEAVYLEADGRLYLRVATERDYPLWGRHVSAEPWDAARLAAFRAAHPELRDAADYWPDPAAPTAGVAWITAP